jgi:uncharacterized secreted protein with C-terminal beta-propeller domain
MRSGRYSLVAGVAAAALLGCGGTTLPEPQAVQQRLALEGFASCGELEQYIEDTAVLDMRTTLEQYKKGYHGWWGGRGEVMATEAGAPAADGASKAGPQDYTTTNTQVAGVDEADFVKNDGNRIFVLSGNRLYVNQSWPAEELKTLGSLEIEGYPREMFLDEQDRVVVFSGIYTPYALDRSQGDVWCESLWCGYWYSNTVKVTVIDVADLTAPRVTAEYFLPGSYTNSRRIGSSVRLVLADQFRWPQGVQWSPEYQPGLYEDKARLGRAYDALMVKNEKLIRQAQLSDWLPNGKRRLASGQLEEVGYSCADFYKSNAATKLGLVTVATLNLDKPGQDIARTSVVAESGHIYASRKHLYVASGHWWWWPAPGQKDHTYLHKFDLTDPDRALYVASGGVDGHIVDQFSMDENAAGFFRVATTIATRQRDEQNPDNWWGTLHTVNRVSVLGESGNALNVVGRTADMAEGERIFSSRFMGDKGYVVTFRQVDPLFTLDLKDPTAPKIVGELKIPGFSTYIHPLDADHLLTIGTHVDEDQNWRSRSMQLTIFDVSDMAAPKQKFVQKVGSAYGWSEAAHEHKAFNYFPAKKLLAIPFSDYLPNHNGSYWDAFVSDLRVFTVDAQAGFTLRGSVDMKDVFMKTGDYAWDYYWSPRVRRSVMADDYVYAISDGGIRAAHISDLSRPVATTVFPKAQAQK